MAASTFTVTHRTLADADFRSWGGAVSTAIGTAGWTQTADTGQVNWATVTAPGAVQNTVAGYEIWRMNDALHTTYPVYMKLEYGSGSNTPSGQYGYSPNLWVTLGTASNGTGTIITGGGVAPLSRVTLNNGSATYQPVYTDTNTYNCYANGDGSALTLLLWPSACVSPSTFGGLFLLIERTRDTDGSILNHGVSFVYSRSYGAGQATTGTVGLAFQTSNIPAASAYGTAPLMNTTTCSDSGNLYPAPIFTGAVPKLGAPSAFAMGLAVSDMSVGSTTTFTHYSVSNTWTASGGGPPAALTQGWGKIDPSGNITAWLVRTT